MKSEVTITYDEFNEAVKRCEEVTGVSLVNHGIEKEAGE